MKTLVLYYSFGSNTKRIANFIQNKLNCDIAEIETVIPYTGSYNSIVDQGQREVNNGYMPEIKEINNDINNYDKIILGSPVWWYTFAPAMKTFLHYNNFFAKEVYPFATNGGWIGHTFEDFKKECVGANVHHGLNVRFDEDRLITSEKDISDWLNSIK